MTKDITVVDKDDIDIYRKIVVNQIPRILGFGDRDPASVTFGCFDRYYWHYKMHDYPNIRFQEVSLLLSLLYKNKFKENKFYHNEKLYHWICGTINFWQKHQHKKGSFDENYPYEQGFCVTAFSSWMVSEVLLLFSRKDKQVLETLAKAGLWLSKHENFEVANQMAAAACALMNISRLLNDKKFKEAAKSKIFSIIRIQSNDGFFNEYGGGDTGYQSITLSCLINLYKQVKWADLEKAIKNGLMWLEQQISEKAVFDFRKGSRQTQFIYPYGLIKTPHLIQRHIYGLRENAIINPQWMDDRYVIPVTIDYLRTYLEFLVVKN